MWEATGRRIAIQGQSQALSEVFRPYLKNNLKQKGLEALLKW
jgi:hypothetical protein